MVIWRWSQRNRYEAESYVPKVRKYTVSLYATSSLGCKDTVVKVNYISVYDSISPLSWLNDTFHCDTNAHITFVNHTVYPSSDDLGLGANGVECRRG